MTPGVVRVGNTVRRPRSEHSARTGEALTWLAAHGFRAAPRYLGVDEHGRDVLEFVEGVTTEHPLQRDERAYGHVARMLRDLHALTHGSDLAPDGSSLLHGDPGPFNVICRGGMPVALIDWDAMHAGDPLEDVGYAAWTWCILSIGSAPVEDQALRLARFRDAYDPALTADDILQTVFDAQQRVIDAERAIAQDPRIAEGRRMHAHRAVDWATSDREFVEHHGEVFENALR